MQTVDLTYDETDKADNSGEPCPWCDWEACRIDRNVYVFEDELLIFTGSCGPGCADLIEAHAIEHERENEFVGDIAITIETEK